MRKTYIYIFCLILSVSTSQLKAQNCWSPLGSGIGINPSQNIISEIATYNNSLIAAGEFDSIGGIAAKNIATWNGSSWSTLGTGLAIKPSYSTGMYVASMLVYNGELYVAGQFDTAGGIPVNNIAKWNGTLWSSVRSGMPGNSYTVEALALYNGALYAAGRFDTAGGIIAHNIAMWDGTQWSSVDSGIGIVNSNQSVVYSLASYNGTLYAGGTFNRAGNVPVNNIAAWNDTTWSALGTGIGSMGGQVTSMAFYQGNLYAALLGSAGPHYSDSLAMWNGTVWSSICSVTPIDFNIGIDALFAFDGNLIIGGAFDTIGGIAANNLAQWDGTTFSEFGGGISSAINVIQVGTFTTYNEYLYTGGYFTWAGSDSAATNSIAEYTCATDGINKVSANHLHVYPNPTTGMINISIDNAKAGSSVQIYDLLGQKIFQSNISNNNTSINLSGYAPGSYIYHISEASSEGISKGTLIIE